MIRYILLIIPLLFVSFTSSFAQAEGEGAAAVTCDTSSATAKKKCTSAETSAQMMQMLQMASVASRNGDNKKLCQAGQALQAAGMASNVYFGMQCQTAARTCNSTCMKEAATEKAANNEAGATASEAKASACEDLKENAKVGYMQAGMAAINMVAAGKCADSLSGVKCEKVEDITNKPECYFQLCGPGGRWNGTEHCKTVAKNCSDPSNFGDPYCICQSNPKDPICPGNNANNNNGNNMDNPWGNNPGGTGAQNDANYGDDDLKALASLGEGDEATQFTKPEPSSLQGNSQAGGAFAPGGGYNGNPGANPKGGGPGKGPYNTDILQGTSGGGGYAAGGGGAYPFGNANSGSKGSEEKGFDLKDFLPGGKGAERAVAGKAELEKNGVSDANGLSNFQKVTRQMNELRRRQQMIESKQF